MYLYTIERNIRRVSETALAVCLKYAKASLYSIVLVKQSLALSMSHR